MISVAMFIFPVLIAVAIFFHPRWLCHLNYCPKAGEKDKCKILRTSGPRKCFIEPSEMTFFKNLFAEIVGNIDGFKD